jgi:hypothetical protein
MFVLRTWVNFDLDLSMLKAGVGPLCALPASSLPIIAAVLAGFYEIDNSPSSDDKKDGEAGGGASSKKGAGKKVRVADEDESAEDEQDEEPASAKKKGR